MSKTIKYNPAAEQNTKNNFLEEYFSGADVDIYINDVLCENISSVSYSLQEQLKPLYGYASRLFDDVAVGNRIVTGSITMPVTNTEYTDGGYIGGDLDLSSVSIESDYTPSGLGGIENTSYPKMTYNTPSWVKVLGDDIPDGTVFTNKLIILNNDNIHEYQQKMGINKTNAYDNGTIESILDYQTKNKLPITGIFDYNTVKSLGSSNKEIKATKSNVNATSAPSDSAYVMFNIKNGESVTVIEEINHYLKVDYKGIICYIDKNSV